MWYTQKVIKGNERRIFIRIDDGALSDDWEVWTNAQKEEWEQARKEA